MGFCFLFACYLSYWAWAKQGFLRKENPLLVQMTEFIKIPGMKCICLHMQTALKFQIHKLGSLWNKNIFYASSHSDVHFYVPAFIKASSALFDIEPWGSSSTLFPCSQACIWCIASVLPNSILGSINDMISSWKPTAFEVKQIH